MKIKSIICSLMVFSLISTIASRSFGQNPSEPSTPPPSVNLESQKNLIALNPLGLIFGSLGLEYQRALSPRLAILVAPAFASSSATTSEGTSIKSTGFSLNVGPVVYLSKQAFEGWNFKLDLGFLYAEASGAGSSTGTGFTAEALIGYRWLWKNGFNLALGIGGRYVNFSVEAGETTMDFSGGGLAAEFSLGLAF